MNRVIQVFRTGTHTDAAGVERTFTPEHLRAIADKYDPENHPAPMVKGHPADDDPAYGWIDRFIYEETSGVLYAIPKDGIEPNFQGEVRAGRYSRISMALYSPDSTHNPVPGVFYPRHVGFLGAAAPAVKGLKAANFGDTDEDYLMFNSAKPEEMNQFADTLAGKIVAGLKSVFVKDDSQGTGAPGDPPDPKASTEYKEIEGDLATAQAKLEEERKARKKQEAEAARTECNQFAEDMVKDGRLTPAMKPGVVELLFAMRSIDTEIEFTAGEKGKEKTIKGTPAELFEGFIKSLGKRIEYGEISNPDGDGVSGYTFKAPPGVTVDRTGFDLAARAQAYAKENDVDYIDALTIVGGTH